MDQTLILHGQPVTREALLHFKKLYMQALRKGRTQFLCDGQEVLVAYAKYVVEYAENELGTLK
jgi:hypothetical protein